MPKDAIAKRLKDAIDLQRKPISKDIEDLVANLVSFAGPLPDRLPAPTQKAFEAFGLDPDDPVDRRTLLHRMADVLFGARRKPVTKRETDRTFELRVAKRVIENEFPGISTTETARRSRERWPGLVHSIEPESVRRALYPRPRKRSKTVT